MPELQHKDTETIEVEKLIPYANNPKEHPEEQVNEIASSIKNYGFVQPIVTDADNEIIIGHGRLEAAKKLGLDEVPVIKHEDITEAEAQALRLADNKIADTGMDQEKLAVELDQLTDQENYDELVTGFTEERTSEILDEYREQTEGELEEPDTPEMEEVETDIQEGEVYQLGHHRLMCGDATDEDDVETLMDGKKADMVFTDPPYGIDYQSNHREAQFEKLENDHKIIDAEKILYPNVNGHLYVCTGEQVYPIWREKFSGGYKNTIIWQKDSQGMGDLENDYAPLYEMIIYCNPNNTSLNGHREPNVWEISRDDVNEYKHPTQKPVKLPAKAIQNSSNKEETVLDAFGGSGSTLLAAEQTNRKCLMMELEPKYCQVIIDRWENLTGQQAEKLKNT